MRDGIALAANVLSDEVPGTDTMPFAVKPLLLRRDVVLEAHDCLRREGEPNARHVDGQVLGDGVLDHLEQFVWSVGGADGQFLQQLHHETAEALERAWNAYRWVDADEHVLLCVHVNRADAPSLVQGAVEYL